MTADATQLHAACVAIGGRGILLLGASGSGKSDLALRLIDRGAQLVADDRVDVYISPSQPHLAPSLTLPRKRERERSAPSPTSVGEGRGGGLLIASAPERLRGLLELRSVGILTLPYLAEAPLALVVMLVAREETERMPEPAFFDCLGRQVPLLSLYAFDGSSDAKIRLYLEYGV